MKKNIFILLCLVFVLYAMLFAQEADQLIFSHQFHLEEAGASCSDCHGAAETSVNKSDNLLPSMETCYQCHDESETECSKCHTNPDMAEELPRIINYVANFAHKTHVDNGVECLKCHQGMDSKENPKDGGHIPVSSVCTDCHGTSDFAENKAQCITCHSEEFAFKPADHTVFWNKDHGISWEIKTNSCEHCHAEMYCINCHQGDNLNREIHPNNYRTTHGLDARANKENCVTCHQELSFCNDCHSIEMVMPRNHSFVSWSSGPGGGLHAKEAQYDFDYCQTCHSDANADVVCVKCHGQ